MEKVERRNALARALYERWRNLYGIKPHWEDSIPALRDVYLSLADVAMGLLDPDIAAELEQLRDTLARVAEVIDDPEISYERTPSAIREVLKSGGA